MNLTWIIIIIVSLYLAVRALNNARKVGRLPRHFNDLIKKVQTDENKAQIEGVVEFHNNRVAAGADGDASFSRLVREIKRIGGIDEDGPKVIVVPKKEVPSELPVTPTEATTEEELNEIEGLCGHIPIVWPLNDLDAEHCLCTRRLTELTAKLVKEIRQGKGA